MNWAAESWHILQARAVALGVIARPGGPVRLLDLDGVIFLAFCEAVLRESQKHAEGLEKLYADSRPRATTPPPGRADRRERNAAIERAARLFGG